VRVYGLTAAPQYNGRLGRRTTELEHGRVAVLLDGDTTEKSFHPRNLEYVKVCLEASAVAAAAAGNALKLKEGDIKSVDMKALCRTIVIVQLQPSWNSDALDMRSEGKDRAVLMDKIKSVLYLDSNSTLGFVCTNEPEVTQRKIREYGAECRMLIQYRPAVKRLSVCCMRGGCSAVIREGRSMVWCGGCLMPRFCSEQCAAMDEEHACICSPDPAGTLPTDATAGTLAAVCEANIAAFREMSAEFVENLRDLKSNVVGDEMWDAFNAHFRACSLCGTTGFNFDCVDCHVCKDSRYCSSACQVSHQAEHAQHCTPFPCRIGVSAGVVSSKVTHAMPYDHGARLMTLGMRATAVYITAKEALSYSVDAASWRLCQEACDIRLEEARGWESLGDYIGAGKAYWAAAMYYMELDDCHKGLVVLRQAKTAVDAAPQIFRRKHLADILVLGQMLDATTNLALAALADCRRQVLRRKWAHRASSSPSSARKSSPQ
jgi:hypothetical protein